jgi:hypothetical protein
MYPSLGVDNVKKSKELRSAIEAEIDMTCDISDEMRKVKAAFWAAYQDNPVHSVITLSMVLQVTNENKVKQWWNLPGFKEWFCNKDEFRQRVEYLANVALDTIEQILINPDANPNARQNAAKLMIEVANKMPSRHAKEKFLDAQIQEMGKRELEAYIRKHSLPLKEGDKDVETAKAEDSE